MQNEERQVLAGFAVLEGIDGAGTTTQLRLIEARLAERGLPHWTSFEPSDLPTGTIVREALSGRLPVEPGTLAHLFAADRHEHLHGREGALARLERGELVVFDRYLFSSLAYQGMTCGPALPALLNAAFPLPELLIYFDLDVERAMGRVARRPDRDIFEVHEFQERVRKAYEEVLAGFSGSRMRLLRIDASAPLPEVSRRVGEAVDALVEARRAGTAG